MKNNFHQVIRLSQRKSHSYFGSLYTEQNRSAAHAHRARDLQRVLLSPSVSAEKKPGVPWVHLAFTERQYSSAPTSGLRTNRRVWRKKQRREFEFPDWTLGAPPEEIEGKLNKRKNNFSATLLFFFPPPLSFLFSRGSPPGSSQNARSPRGAPAFVCHAINGVIYGVVILRL